MVSTGSQIQREVSNRQQIIQSQREERQQAPLTSGVAKPGSKIAAGYYVESTTGQVLPNPKQQNQSTPSTTYKTPSGEIVTAQTAKDINLAISLNVASNQAIQNQQTQKQPTQTQPNKPTPEQIKQFNTTGGYYVSGTGQMFSSPKSPEYFGSTIKNENQPITLFKTPEIYKYIIPQGTQVFGNPVKVVDLTEANNKSVDLGKVGTQRGTELYDKAKTEAGKELINQWITPTTNQTTSPNVMTQINNFNQKITQRDFDKQFYENPPIFIHEQNLPPQLSEYKQIQDISQDIYEKQINQTYKTIQNQSSFEKLVLAPNAERVQDLVTRKYTDPVEGLFNKIKGTAVGTYDWMTDLGGYFLMAGTKSHITLGTYTQFKTQQDLKIQEYNKQGLLNPRQAILYDLPQIEKQEIQQRTSDFYTGKQIIESTLAFIPQTTSLAIIGGASRAKTIEETIPPLILGATTYFGAPIAGKAGQTLIQKINTNLETGLNKIFTSKLPVPENVIAVRHFANLINESTIAKAIPLIGISTEVGGLQFFPNEQKKEYIRQIGLYNAFVPIGYKTALTIDTLAQYAKIKLVSAIGGTSTIKAIDLMDTAKQKFIETGGGTPVFRGTEKELYASTIGDEGTVSKKLFEVAGIEPGTQVVMMRSAKGKLLNEIEPSLSMYEAGEQSFFSTELHPIALREVGLTKKLFGMPAQDAEYVLYTGKPYAEVAFSKHAFSFGLKESFGEIEHEQLKQIYGLKQIKKAPSEQTMFGKAIITPEKTISEFEFEKIIGGGRPVKTREPIALMGEESFRKFGLLEEGDIFKGYPTFFTSQSRSIYRTSESEVLTSTSRERVIVPETKTYSITLPDILGGKTYSFKPREYFKSKGFADIYIEHDFEFIPANIEKLSTRTTAIVPKGNNSRLLENVKLPEPQESTKRIGSSSLIKQQNELTKAFSKKESIEPGGYSQELSDTFKKVTNYEKSARLSAYTPKYFKTSYSNNYTSNKSYLPKYSSNYNPKYSPSYAQEYAPKYTPNYYTSYAPKYLPLYNPTYNPQYTPNYTPNYTPTYTPNYPPKYTPNYIPITEPKIPTTYNPKEDSRKKRKKKTPGFYAYTRRYGKEIRISDVLGESAAWTKGLNIARKTLARSAIIKPAGTTIELEETQAPSFFGFRRKTPTSKIRTEPIAIEINPLSSKSEIKEIQAARKNKQAFKVKQPKLTNLKQLKGWI